MPRSRKPWDREPQDRKKRAERLARRTPYVYFFRCLTFIKIGWTTDPDKRFDCVQLANPHVITLAALIRGGERQEAALHRAFKQFRHRAEWFREEGALAELLKLIEGQDDPAEARVIAGDWFLKTFGKLDLLAQPTSELGRHKNGNMDERIPQE